MSIEKKSLISTLKTTRKANAASSEPAAVAGKSAISTKQISTRRAGVSTKQISTKRAAASTKQISTRRAGVSTKQISTRAVLN